MYNSFTWGWMARGFCNFCALLICECEDITVPHTIMCSHKYWTCVSFWNECSISTVLIFLWQCVFVPVCNWKKKKNKRVSQLFVLQGATGMCVCRKRGYNTTTTKVWAGLGRFGQWFFFLFYLFQRSVCWWRGGARFMGYKMSTRELVNYRRLFSGPLRILFFALTISIVSVHHTHLKKEEKNPKTCQGLDQERRGTASTQNTWLTLFNGVGVLFRCNWSRGKHLRFS